MVAAANGVGGDGAPLGGGEREPEKGGRSERGSGRRVASPGVEEGGNQAGGGQGEAGGGRGLSGACHASPLFVLLAEEEEDKGEEVGWAGQMELGQVSGPGGFLLCFIFFLCFVLFNFVLPLF